MNPFAKVGTVSELGEKALIARVCKNFGSSAALPPPFGAGDDCALIRSRALSENVFITSDAVILGRHFSPDTPPEMAGEKLVKRNASDIAAMGATPFAALASSICSPNVSLGWLDGFCRGMGRAAERYGVKIIGGDFASVGGDFFSTHLTLLGQSGARPLLRTGTEIGDYICTTGELGASFESGHHLTFEPRLNEGRFLAADSAVSACMDISDGLASDLKCLLPPHSCAEISTEDLPIRKFGGKCASVRQALCDGEDYELVFAYRGTRGQFDEFLRRYEDAFGYSAHEIGRITKPRGACEEGALVLVSGGLREVFKSGGFDHYAAR